MENITLDKAIADLKTAKKKLCEKQDRLFNIESHISALEKERNVLNCCAINMETEIKDIIKNSEVLGKDKDIIMRDLEQFKSMSEEVSITMNSLLKDINNGI